MVCIADSIDQSVDYAEADIIEISQLSHLFDCLPPECNNVNLDLASPKSFQKAISGPDGDKWLEPCRKEINAMVERKVWVLVDRPPRPTNII